MDGHLPTGSSASPIISFFAYEDMFDDLNCLAQMRSCTMTVYIDDVVFTGPGATQELLYEARKVMARYRLLSHKTKVFRSKQPKVLTGIAVTRDGPKLPNKRQKSIALDFDLHNSLAPSEQKLVIARRLTGKLYEAAQVDPSWKTKADAFAASKNALEVLLQSGN